MAITLVGTGQVGAASNGGDVTLTFDGSPAEDDVVFLVGGHGDSNATGHTQGPSTAGYTELMTFDNDDYALGVWYKALGASPDASVTGQGDGVAQNATAYASYVLRGVDTTTPSDATPTEAGPDAGVGPYDSPSITTVTDGAWVISWGTDQGATIQTGAPTGYSNLVAATGVDTNRFNVAAATKEVTTAGAEDPGVFTDGGDTNAAYTVTVAVRPAGAGGGATPKGVFGLALHGPLRRAVY